MIRVLLALSLVLAACAGDETVSGYAEPGAVYVLEELRGQPFTARATLTFPEPGQVAGQGPCNSYAARQGVPYPWIRIEAIVATRRACPELRAEGAFLAALNAASLVEAQGNVLILSDDSGELAVFRVQR